jgi:hypothetical protein
VFGVEVSVMLVIATEHVMAVIALRNISAHGMDCHIPECVFETSALETQNKRV